MTPKQREDFEKWFKNPDTYLCCNCGKDIEEAFLAGAKSVLVRWPSFEEQESARLVRANDNGSNWNRGIAWLRSRLFGEEQ
jgi:hypothetical protein